MAKNAAMDNELRRKGMEMQSHGCKDYNPKSQIDLICIADLQELGRAAGQLGRGYHLQKSEKFTTAEN